MHMQVVAGLLFPRGLRRRLIKCLTPTKTLDTGHTNTAGDVGTDWKSIIKVSAQLCLQLHRGGQYVSACTDSTLL